MEPVTLATLATFLSPLFLEGGKTLAVESVKLALANRHDIKDKILDVFRPEIISLNLSEYQKPEEVKALIEAKPDVEAEIKKKVKSNSDLLDQLAKILSKQEGRTIHATNYFEHVNIINIDQRRS